MERNDQAPEGGYAFDAGINQNGIMKIEIRHGQQIDAIKGVYRDNNETPWYGGSGGQLSKFLLDKDDTIIEITVWQSVVIDALQFRTQKGIISPKYGGQGGKRFVYPAPPEKCLVGFIGKHGEESIRNFVPKWAAIIHKKVQQEICPDTTSANNNTRIDLKNILDAIKEINENISTMQQKMNMTDERMVIERAALKEAVNCEKAAQDISDYNAAIDGKKLFSSQS